MLALALGASSAGASAAATTPAGEHRIVASDLRELMVRAIDSPSGSVSAILRNSDTDWVARRFQASSPLYVDITTLVVYAQPGCRRLQLQVRLDGVAAPGPGFAPGDRAMTYGINYCRDGKPPRSLQVAEARK